MYALTTRSKFVDCTNSSAHDMTPTQANAWRAGSTGGRTTAAPIQASAITSGTTPTPSEKVARWPTSARGNAVQSGCAEFE